MLCRDSEDPHHQFTCSVDGCGNHPEMMVVLNWGDPSSVLLCHRHFKEARDDILSCLEVPPWLMEADAFHSLESSVVFDFEYDSMTGEPSDDMPPPETRRAYRARS